MAGPQVLDEAEKPPKRSVARIESEVELVEGVFDVVGKASDLVDPELELGVVFFHGVGDS